MAGKPSEDKFFEDEKLNTYTPITFCKQFKRMWRRSDMYAIPVTLRYKGEKSFYTNYGAGISNVVIFVLLGFFFSGLNTMLSSTNTSSSYREKLSYLNKEICMDPRECPYIFGFRLIETLTGKDYEIDPTYFDVKIHSYRNVWNNPKNDYEIYS
jgi:hypothetical protein